MQKFLLLLLSLFTSLSVSAQEVISSEQQANTLATIINLVLPIRVDYDVANYKITYSTVDALGQPDTASGLLCIPLVSGDLLLPMAVYNHGTVGERDAVPSNSTTQERLIAHVIAASGYITVAPDYIGLGDSDGIHPYVHAASEASAGRDLVIAVRKWLENENILFNDQLFLTGYSQGGHATQALHRDLQTNPGDDEIEVTAASHLSGPYSISDVMAGTLFSEGLATLPGYIAYTYVSYNSVYGLFDSLAQAFVPPYLPLIEAFANEELSLGDFNTQLTQLLTDNNALLADILQDSIRQTLASGDPTAPINMALADNDTYDWAPTAPTLIYYCTQDEQVPFRNAIIADSVMRANGSTSVVLETGGALTHGGCIIPAITRTLDFWEQYAERFTLSLGVPVTRPDITLAPNPVLAGGQLRLNGIGNAALPYHIYDLSGRQVSDGTTSINGTLRLPNHLTHGLHVLRIGLEDGTSLVRKVIIK
jgi:pimeloyl-ACP methyl ester carboxylesterase